MAEVMPENLKEILKAKGYRATPARLAILQIFSRHRSPLDARGVLGELGKIRKLHRTNEATVYRTLCRWRASGILRQVDLRRDSVYFELSALPHHHHIICTGCNAIEDFAGCQLERGLRQVVARSAKFKKITEHSLELFGLCRSCAG